MLPEVTGEESHDRRRTTFQLGIPLGSCTAHRGAAYDARIPAVSASVTMCNLARIAVNISSRLTLAHQKPPTWAASTMILSQVNRIHDASEEGAFSETILPTVARQEPSRSISLRSRQRATA